MDGVAREVPAAGLSQVKDHASLSIVHPRALLLISMVPTCAVWAICHVPLMDWSEASTLVAPVLRSFALNAAGGNIRSDGCFTRQQSGMSARHALFASPMHCHASRVSE